MDAWIRLLRGHAAVTRELSSQLVADHGLTINDYECLLHLSRAPENGLRRVDLAELLLLTASGVTRLLDGLEREGWVGKRTCESDARVTYAVLTEDGRRKLAEAGCGHVAAIREVFENRFSPEELATLAHLLGRLPGADSSVGETCTGE
jgi:DNA-binding MarR family transcriptional regulator